MAIPRNLANFANTLNTNGQAPAAGSSGQVQFNSSGVFGGSANMTFNGSTLTVADLTDASLSPGRVVFPTTGGNLIGSANFFWDNGNARLGIGTSTPTVALDVRVGGVAALFTATNSNANQIGFSNAANAAAGFYMGSPSQGALQFSDHNGIERARITSGGDLLVGTTTSNGRTTVTTSNDQKVLQLNQTNASPSASSTLLYINQGAATQTPPAIQYYSASFGGAIYFQVLGNGNVQNANNSYGSTSDIKLKENITDATPKLEALNQLRVVNYNFKGQMLKQIGLIAQEVEQVFPGLVESSPDRDADGNDLGTTTKSVKYSVLVPMLLKAVQELTAQNDELRQRVSTLEQASK